jgi:hypothetical protein
VSRSFLGVGTLTPPGIVTSIQGVWALPTYLQQLGREEAYDLDRAGQTVAPAARWTHKHEHIRRSLSEKIHSKHAGFSTTGEVSFDC